MISSCATPASGQPVTLRTTSPQAPFGREADCVERVHHFGQRLDREPVKLDVLAHGDVGKVAGILAREAADGAQLAARR